MSAKKELRLKLDYKDLARVKRRLPWATASVDDVSAINLVQMLTAAERINFVNELHRVMKVGAKAQIIVPHWCSSRAFGDLAFPMPPVSEAWGYHLNAEWRKANAPWSKGYKCDFDYTFGYGMHQLIVSRNVEYQQHAVSFFKEAAQDFIATFTKR